MRRDIKEHGPTTRCKGCENILSNGTGSVNHTEECRKRYLEIFAEKGDERAKKEDERMTN